MPRRSSDALYYLRGHMHAKRHALDKRQRRRVAKLDVRRIAQEEAVWWYE